MDSAGPSWEESEKENFCKSRKELETLVTFLSKFDSKVAAIWEGDDQRLQQEEFIGGLGKTMQQQIWEEEGTMFTGTSTFPCVNLLSTTIETIPSATQNSTINNTNVIEEDLLVSSKTHFKPIRDYREEIPPPLAFLPLPQQDPAEYAIYNRTANSSYPLQFKLKTENDKAVQTDFSPPSSSSFLQYGTSPFFNFKSSN